MKLVKLLKLASAAALLTSHMNVPLYAEEGEEISANVESTTETPTESSAPADNTTDTNSTVEESKPAESPNTESSSTNSSGEKASEESISIIEPNTAISESSSASSSESGTNNESDENLSRPRTEAEAKAYAEKWAEEYRAIMIREHKIPKKVLDKLPADAFYNTLVQWALRTRAGGDPGTHYTLLRSLYPEAFNERATSYSTAERREILEVASERAEVLNNEIARNTPSETLPVLKEKQVFEFDTASYEVKRMFLVRPDEQANSEEASYLLGITVAYTNKGDKPMPLAEQEWLINTKLTQKIDGTREELSFEHYKIDNEVSLVSYEAIQPNETMVHTIYYKIVDLKTPVIVTSTLTSGVKEFSIPVEPLRQLPPQSAIYFNETSDLVSYIFDFDTLYLAYSTSEAASIWKDNSNATIQSQRPKHLSRSAARHFVKLDSNYTIVTLKDLNFTQKDDDILIEQQGKTILTLQSKDDWATFTTSQSETYTRHLDN